MLAFSLIPSKSTSPQSFAFPSGVIPIRLTPTSITTAPSLTTSAVIALGFPAATTRISAAGVKRHVAGSRVTDRHRHIGPCLLLQKDVCNGLAHNVRSSNHNNLGSICFHARPNKELLDSSRSSRKIIRFPNHQFSDIDRVKSVHIFFRIDGIEHPGLVDVFRQRQLDQNPMNFRILVIVVDEFEELIFSDAFRLSWME
jgi:hypothetical protein